MDTHGTSFEIEICNTLHSKLGVPLSLLGQDNWDKPLSANPIRMSAVDLTYLFFELEKTFQLRIDELHLYQYGFSSITAISKILKCCVGN